MSAAKVASLVVAAASLWLRGRMIASLSDVAERVVGVWSAVPDGAVVRYRSVAALRDEEPSSDDEDDGDEPHLEEKLPMCPAEIDRDLPFAERHVVRMAYGNSGWLWGLGAYLAAAHAWWCWSCWRTPREEPPAGRRAVARAFASRASPAW